MAYANQDKLVTLVFLQAGRTEGKKPLYRRAGFNYVSFDGDPDRFVEPVPVCLQVDTVGTGHTIYSTQATAERIVGVEHMAAHPMETQVFAPEYVDLS